MKKSCKGCKALLFDRDLFMCDLGYHIKTKLIEVKPLGKILYPIPKENCPKPLTFKKHIELMDKQIKDQAKSLTRKG